MKSCKKCFEYAYIFVGGDVRMCPWNGIVIGNLLENTLEEIWRGEKAEEVRKAFMHGHLLGCSEQYCPDCINKSTTLEIEEEELQRFYAEMPDLPANISLAYDERCNHACPSCRHEFFHADEKYRSDLKKITENIEPYLGKIKHIATNGIGDLFVSKEILDMISRFHPKDPEFSMFIETNGVLFKDNWKKLEHLSKYNLTVSVTPNSFDRETYRYLAGKDDLAKFEESMQFITDLKRSGSVNHIRIIMVIQDSNFRQIPQFIKKCIEYDADDIVLRPIFKWFGMKEDELLYKNVLNPCHPYYKEYEEIIKDPICEDPRVFNWGFEEKQEAVPFPTLEMARAVNGVQEQELRKRIPDIESKLENINEQIVLYGAGNVGKFLLKEMTSGDRKMDVCGFAVSCVEGNPKYWMGYPIRTLQKYLEETEKYIFVLATTNEYFRKEMEEKLLENGITDYISL